MKWSDLQQDFFSILAVYTNFCSKSDMSFVLKIFYVFHCFFTIIQINKLKTLSIKKWYQKEYIRHSIIYLAPLSPISRLYQRLNNIFVNFLWTFKIKNNDDYKSFISFTEKVFKKNKYNKLIINLTISESNRNDLK
jgi:hypothetical protein